MSRRKHLVVRTSSGRAQRSTRDALLPPTETRRLFDAAASGLRDPIWGSMLARCHLAGKINASEFSAGKKWCELTAEYAVACQCPREPRTAAFDARGGTPADPDSATGQREAKRHARASAAFVEGKHALRLAGSNAEAAVEQICIRDFVPAGFQELELLRTGLQALSSWWSSTRRKAAAR